MFNKQNGLRPNEGRSFLKDDRGAIDLPSTMVTAVILGILFTAVVLSVFKIIPWAQDIMAEHNAETVAAALDQYQTQSQSGIISGAQVQKDGYSFANGSGLVTSGIIAKIPADVTIELFDGAGTAFNPSTGTPNSSTTDDSYVVKVESKTGKVFTVSGGATTP